MSSKSPDANVHDRLFRSQLRVHVYVHDLLFHFQRCVRGSDRGRNFALVLYPLTFSARLHARIVKIVVKSRVHEEPQACCKPCLRLQQYIQYTVVKIQNTENSIFRGIRNNSVCSA